MKPLLTNWIEIPFPAAPASERCRSSPSGRMLKSRSLFAPAKLTATFACTASSPPLNVAVAGTGNAPAPVLATPPSTGKLIVNSALVGALASSTALIVAAVVPPSCSTPTPCVLPSPPASVIHRSVRRFPGAATRRPACR